MANISADININDFVRKDVYHAEQRALISEIRLGNAEILKKIEQVEVNLNGKIEKVSNELNSKIDNVSSELNGKIDKVNERIDKLEIEIDGKFEKVNSRIDQLETKVDAVNIRLDDMSTRISDSYSLMSWGIGLMGAVIAFLLIISPAAAFIKKLFTPSITLEQIDELITARLRAANINTLTQS